MNVKYSLKNNNLIIRLSGELDEYVATKLRDVIDDIIDKNSSVTALIFNLNGLTFVDSTGIGMMIGRYKKAKSYRIKTYIENPSLALEKILELSGLYQIMPLVKEKL